MLVITADQRGSRSRDDLVPAAIQAIQARVGDRLALDVDRNAGDELQLATADGTAALEAALLLVRSGDWWVGIGAGAVELPLPASVRAARGAAFIHARAAVDRAKRAQWRLAIAGEDEQAAADAEAIVRVLLEMRERRSDPGWELADLLEDGMTQREAADRLGVSETAVSLRAKAAGLRADEAALPAIARMLDALAGEPTTR